MPKAPNMQSTAYSRICGVQEYAEFRLRSLTETCILASLRRHIQITAFRQTGGELIEIGVGQSYVIDCKGCRSREVDHTHPDILLFWNHSREAIICRVCWKAILCKRLTYIRILQTYGSILRVFLDSAYPRKVKISRY